MEKSTQEMEKIEKELETLRVGIVTISEDDMRASIEVYEPSDDSSVTLDMIKEMLDDEGVKAGIDEEVIKSIISEKRYGESIQVAFGKAAEDGMDGKYIYHFNTHPRSSPKLMEDGSVDYRNLECFEGVQKDQLIAEYQPETSGEDGYDVRGNVLTAKRGRPLPAIRGKHIYKNEDSTKFYSDIDGKITYDDMTDRISITDVYVVSGDVDSSTGNIKFKGNIEILGSVCSGFMVEAAGSVVIDGIVESATIKSGGNIIIRKGMNGNGRGIIIAGGNVEGGFFEQANIECGGYLHANSIMNCYIDCKDEVELSGTKGVLLAGRVRALKGVKANNIGNEAEVPTYIKVGLDPKMRQRFEVLRRDQDLLKREIEKITNAQEKLKTTVVPPEQKAVMADNARMLMRTKITKSTELEKLRVESEELEQQFEVGKHAAVVVANWVHAGCSVTINGATNNVKEDIRGVVFTFRKGNVIMGYNGM